MRRPADAVLDGSHMRSIAAQLLTSAQIDVDGHRYKVTEVGAKKVKSAKFVLGDRKYEAIEQNPDTASHWADLAREGHRVVHFRDLVTKEYIAVVVDGEPIDESAVHEER